MHTSYIMKKIFIGLGNPGKKYQKTRHNVGQTVIDRLGESPQNCLYLKTDQYMNNSGIFVQKIVNFYKINPDSLYIIHDDLDLGVGEWRLQFDRGPAGHHGIESIIQHLGTKSFWRFRIGIGHPKNIPVEDYVLKPFLPAEKVLIEEVVDKITTEIIKIANEK